VADSLASHVVAGRAGSRRLLRYTIFRVVSEVETWPKPLEAIPANLVVSQSCLFPNFTIELSESYLHGSGMVAPVFEGLFCNPLTDVRCPKHRGIVSLTQAVRFRIGAC
jgi:hypothetical protein